MSRDISLEGRNSPRVGYYTGRDQIEVYSDTDSVFIEATEIPELINFLAEIEQIRRNSE